MVVQSELDRGFAHDSLPAGSRPAPSQLILPRRFLLGEQLIPLLDCMPFGQPVHRNVHVTHNGALGAPSVRPRGPSVHVACHYHLLPRGHGPKDKILVPRHHARAEACIVVAAPPVLFRLHRHDPGHGPPGGVSPSTNRHIRPSVFCPRHDPTGLRHARKKAALLPFPWSFYQIGGFNHTHFQHTIRISSAVARPQTGPDALFNARACTVIPLLRLLFHRVAPFCQNGMGHI